MVQGVATGNNPPTVTAAASFDIPHSTPFQLTASASDPDGDPPHYCWEELDPGNHPAALAFADDGLIPLFRSFEPTSQPYRVFARMSLLATDKTADDEKLPIRSRPLRFRVTVRDGRAGLGSAETLVRVHDDAGPFRVTAPAAGSTCGRTAKVSWDVAGTDSSSIGATHVNILVTTDNGQSFTALATDTPNDGSQDVLLPPSATSTAKIRVEAVGSVFFALSPGNFAIDPSLSTTAAIASAREPAGNNAVASMKEPPPLSRGEPASAPPHIIVSSPVDLAAIGARESESKPGVIVITSPVKVAEILSIVGSGARRAENMPSTGQSRVAARPAADNYRISESDAAELRQKLRVIEQQVQELLRQLESRSH